jgi:hypothetical protein
MMTTKRIQSLLETWLPKPTKTMVKKFPSKEGKKLPNSVTEDVIGMSLMPHYSTKQLRKIGRKQRKYSETFMMDISANGEAIQW